MSPIIPIILTRPGEANNQLADAIEERRLAETEIWRWPAFKIELPSAEEQQALEARLKNLDDVEMVVLPSPSAVTAVAHWVDEWPAHVVLATVGEGTARAIRTAFGENANVLAPEGDAEHSGSEALWELVKKRGAPSRVLVPRGQTGREWLPRQFKSIGSDVVTMCAYVRVPLELGVWQQRQLQNAISTYEPPVMYITSTDAVDAMVLALHSVEGALEWATKGEVITLHPRVVRRLREAGFQKISVTSTDTAQVADMVAGFCQDRRRSVRAKGAFV